MGRDNERRGEKGMERTTGIRRGVEKKRGEMKGRRGEEMRRDEEIRREEMRRGEQNEHNVLRCSINSISFDMRLPVRGGWSIETVSSWMIPDSMGC